MANSAYVDRKKLHFEVDGIWASYANTDHIQTIPSIIKDILDLKDLTESLALLDQISKITSKNLETFKQSCNSKKYDDELKTKLISLATWIAALQDSKNQILSKKEKQKVVKKIQDNIKKTKILINKKIKITDPYVHLFNAVNEDNFEKLQAIINANPTLDLNKTNAQGETLLSLAYMRRSYLAIAIADERLIGDKTIERARDNETNRNGNEKIFLFLIKKTNINAKIEKIIKVRKEYMVYRKEIKINSILYYTANETTPSFDLLFFLLEGAHSIPVNKIKKPFFQHEILRIGIPKIFYEEHHALLQDIINDRKDQTETLFDTFQFSTTFLDLIKSKPATEKGQIFYGLLTFPDDALKEKVKKFMEENKIENDVGSWINYAGVHISTKEKKQEKANKYYEKAAEFNSKWGHRNLVKWMDYKKDQDSLKKVVHHYVKSYELWGNETIENVNRISIIAELTQMRDQINNPEEKSIVTSALETIYSQHVKNGSLKNAEEKIDFLEKYLEKEENMKTIELIKETLINNIITAWQEDLKAVIHEDILKNKSNVEKGKIFYALLTSHNVSIKEKIKHFIKEHAMENDVGFWINYAGVHIHTKEKNREKANKYYEKAAELNSKWGHRNLATETDYKKDQNSLKIVVHHYLKSYELWGNETIENVNRTSIIAALNAMRDYYINNPEEKSVVTNALETIYSQHVKNGSLKTIEEKLDFLEKILGKEESTKTTEEAKETLINNIITTWQESSKLSEKDKEPEIVFRLLTHPLFSEKILAIIKDNPTLKEKIAAEINIAGVSISEKDQAKADEYYKIASELENKYAIWNFALSLHYRKENLIEAVEYYKKCYELWKIQKNDNFAKLKEIIEQLKKIKNTNKTEDSSAANKALLFIYNQYSLYISMKTSSEKISLLDSIEENEDTKQLKEAIIKNIIETWQENLNAENRDQKLEVVLKLLTHPQLEKSRFDTFPFLTIYEDLIDQKSILEKGKIFYDLLTSSNPSTREKINTFIVENKMENNVGFWINDAGFHIVETKESDQEKADEYYRIASELGNKYAIWNFSRALHYRKKDLIKAVEYYKKCYELWEIPSDNKVISRENIVKELQSIQSQQQDLIASQNAQLALDDIVSGLSIIKIWSNKEDGILTILDRSTTGKIATSQLNTAMENWVKKFGDANSFLKIKNQEEIIQRIAEQSILKNKLALDLHEKLKRIWLIKKSPEDKIALLNFLTKELNCLMPNQKAEKAVIKKDIRRLANDLANENLTTEQLSYLSYASKKVIHAPSHGFFSRAFSTTKRSPEAAKSNQPKK